MIRGLGWDRGKRVVAYRAVTDNDELATNFGHAEIYLEYVVV